MSKDNFECSICVIRVTELLVSLVNLSALRARKGFRRWYTRDIHNFRDWCCQLHSSCRNSMHRYTVVLAYILEVSVQNFTQLGGSADFLRPFIWSRISGLMRFRDGSGKGRASDFVQISLKCDGDPGKDRRKAWAVHGKSKLTETEKGETGEEQFQERCS
jgi:hypothetical protein